MELVKVERVEGWGVFTQDKWIETKVCSYCNEKKSLDCFHKRIESRDGLMNCCKDCRKRGIKNPKGPKRTETGKECIECLKIKNYSEFQKNSASKDGRRSACKECTSFKRTGKIKEKLEDGKKRCSYCKIIKDVKNFNKDGRSSQCKECERKTNNKIYQRKRQRRIELGLSKERLSEEEAKRRDKISAKKYREKIKNDPIRYRENRDKINKKWKEKFKNDINFRLSHIARKRIYEALCKSKKSKKTFELIGRSVKDFREYIESLWTDGMSWENYGTHGWHIDHIIPCASFDLTDPEQQKRCFHYTNMQPLWAKDNIRKKDKMPEEWNALK